MSKVASQSSSKFDFSNAVKSAKEASSGGSGNFLRLADGQSVEVVFSGEIVEIAGTWRDKRFVPWQPEYASEGLHKSVRYALLAIRLDERRAVVIEINRPTIIEWGDDLADGVEDKVVRLKRIGGLGDPKARTTARVVRNLRGEESDELDTIPQPSLEVIYADFLGNKAA